MRKIFSSIVIVALGVAAFASPIRSMLGADGAEIIEDSSLPPYIEEGLVWMWSLSDEIPLDEEELSVQLIDMYNGGDFTFEVVFVNTDVAVTGPIIYMNNMFIFGPRNAAPSGAAPNPRPYMNYDGSSYFIGFQYTNPMRLAMSATLSSVTRAWNTYYVSSAITRSITATSASIISKNTLGINEIACIRIYNRALSKPEMDYNYFVDRERFGLL